MVFKIQLNNEIHRVDVKLASYQELTDLLVKKFTNKLPKEYYLEYKDQDNDWIRVSNEEDFSILLEDFETKKSVKLIVQQVGGKQLPENDCVVVIGEYQDVNPVNVEKDKLEEQEQTGSSNSSSSSSDSESDSNSDKKKSESNSDKNSDSSDSSDNMKSEDIKKFLDRFVTKTEKMSTNKNPLIVLRNLLNGLRFRLKQIRKFVPKEQKQMMKSFRQEIQPLMKDIKKTSDRKLKKLMRRNPTNKELNQQWEALQADEKQAELVNKLNNFRSKFTDGFKTLLNKVYYQNENISQLVENRLHFLKKLRQRLLNFKARNNGERHRGRRHRFARHGSCGNHWKKQHNQFWQDVKDQCGDKQMWKQKKKALKEMRKNMSKEEWREQVAEWKQQYGRKWRKRFRNKNRSSSTSSFSNSSNDERDHFWRKKKGFYNRHRKGFWKKFMGKDSSQEREMRQKKNFMMRKWRQKLQNRVQGRIDQTIAQAIPQIAQQVAQILNVNKPEISNDIETQQRIDLANKNNVSIHKGFTCDGCNVKPIIGICYKCSVCKDFDYCETCEATKPHPHPFIKIRNPAQRPDAIFSIIQDDKEKVHPQYIKKCKGMFKQWVQNVKHQAKQTNKQLKQKLKQELKQEKKQHKKQMKQKQKELKRLEKQMKKQEKKIQQQTTKQDDDKQEPKQNLSESFKDVLDDKLIDQCSQLMTIFNLRDENKPIVVEFLRNNRKLEIQDLTNKFIDQVLPSIQQVNIANTPETPVIQ